MAKNKHLSYAKINETDSLVIDEKAELDLSMGPSSNDLAQSSFVQSVSDVDSSKDEELFAPESVAKGRR